MEMWEPRCETYLQNLRAVLQSTIKEFHQRKGCKVTADQVAGLLKTFDDDIREFQERFQKEKELVES